MPNSMEPQAQAWHMGEWMCKNCNEAQTWGFL
jgi:hypothetical protein